MTVDELIEHLRMLPPDAEVLVCDGIVEGDECEGVEGVYLESYRMEGRERAVRTAIIADPARTRSAMIGGPAWRDHV